MTPYTKEDIPPLGDPIAWIRLNRRMFLGGLPIVGPHLAAQVIRDVIWLGALAASVSKIEAWWWILAEQDWLMSNDGNVSLDPFFSIVPFPAKGRNSHRSEVLLTAFADAVVTRAGDETKWITGGPDNFPLPQAFALELENVRRGRILAFRIEEQHSNETPGP
jgi:hypothetical protein